MRRNVLKIMLTIDISIFFVYLGVACFPNWICRVIEACRDIGLSAAYYFCELTEVPVEITPTINEMPAFQFFANRWQPLKILPFEYETFVLNFQNFFKRFFDMELFIGYNESVSLKVFNISRILIIIIPVILLAVILAGKYTSRINVEHDKTSKPLEVYLKFKYTIIKPSVGRIREYCEWLKKYSFILKIWLVIWACYFNVITIFIEALAYYLYFVVSFDFIHIYRQIYKLLLDLSPAIRFIPAPVFIVLGFYILKKVADGAGMNELRHRERINRGFLNERGVVTIVSAPMGAGKTAFLTDIAQSADAELRDRALDIMLNGEFMFPWFPWIKLEDELKIEFKKHRIYDKYSCEKWVEKKHNRFVRKPSREKIFGYDYEREAMEYDDKLTVRSIWSVLKNYAVSYMIYVVKSALIISNYSVRVDNICNEAGNFPIWDNDFFSRDSRLQEVFSRRSHILDYDMLRLGRKMVEKNPNAYAFGFGIYLISEIDKERKNTLELRGVKADEDRANQKNDYFNVNVKMSRHACTVSNENFIYIFGDLQRFGSLGSDITELGELLQIAEKGEMRPTLPFYSPFYLYETLFGLIWNKYVPKFLNRRFLRGDNRLLSSLAAGLVAKMKSYYDKKLNMYGSSRMKLVIQSPMGESKVSNYYLQSKKIYSDRYCTDCQSGIYERFAKYNHVGIEDLETYSGSRATSEELDKQNSYVQNEVKAFGIPDEE